MMQTHTVQFVHRLNEDGTIDSICRNCFITVATAASESVLDRKEPEHNCNPALLNWYKKCPRSEDFS